MKLPDSKLTKSQSKQYQKTINGMNIYVTLRYDDCCGNGHNTFSITADIYKAGRIKSDANMIACGCCHDEIEKYFPELLHLIKWHGCTSDGPLHYIANTTYLAGDKDHYGRRKGEPSRTHKAIQFGNHPISYKGGQKFINWLEERLNNGVRTFAIQENPYIKKNDADYDFSPKYSLKDHSGNVFNPNWSGSPFDDLNEAEEFLSAVHKYGYGQGGSIKFIEIVTEYSEGKEPELQGARNTAIWPDATLEQLRDKNALQKRLPALMERFKHDMESIGFTY